MSRPSPYLSCLVLALSVLAVGCGESPLRNRQCELESPVKVRGRLLMSGRRAMTQGSVQVTLVRGTNQSEVNESNMLLNAADTGLDAVPERFELCGDLAPSDLQPGAFEVLVSAEVNGDRRYSELDLVGRTSLTSLADELIEVDVELVPHE
ncbi:MAG TPA: hypothetical protein VFO83_02265 [Aggregicoccus sp.]|nr:hypothetical protein [Aggregicoccus sp.]